MKENKQNFFTKLLNYFVRLITALIALFKKRPNDAPPKAPETIDSPDADTTSDTSDSALSDDDASDLALSADGTADSPLSSDAPPDSPLSADDAPGSPLSDDGTSDSLLSADGTPDSVPSSNLTITPSNPALIYPMPEFIDVPAVGNNCLFYCTLIHIGTLINKNQLSDRDTHIVLNILAKDLNKYLPSDSTPITPMLVKHILSHEDIITQALIFGPSMRQALRIAHQDIDSFSFGEEVDSVKIKEICEYYNVTEALITSRLQNTLYTTNPSDQLESPQVLKLDSLYYLPDNMCKAGDTTLQIKIDEEHYFIKHDQTMKLGPLLNNTGQPNKNENALYSEMNKIWDKHREAQDNSLTTLHNEISEAFKDSIAHKIKEYRHHTLNPL